MTEPADIAALPGAHQGRRVELLAGFGAVTIVHFGVVAAVIMTPPPGANAAARSADEGPCTPVVSPSCCTGGRVVNIAAVHDSTQPRSRRCPEPMRRRQRLPTEPPPAATVDLLQAQIIERLGSPTGNLPPETKEQPKPATKAERRLEKVAAIVEDGDLKKILKGGKKSRKRRSKLGSILGTAKGRKDGDGLVSRKGSAYVREVRIAMQNAFVLPGQVPVWLRKELRARVRITRMTATGRVLSYRVERKSGNDAFDKTVRRLMSGYKSGMRALPRPPPHILTEINSRGMVVSLRGG